MPRTQYGKRDSLRLETGPGAFAIFSFPPRDSPSATVPGSRLITIPSGSTWKTGLHWHEEYDESVRVVQGRAAITISGVTRFYGPEDGTLTFPKYTVHEFGRADNSGDAFDEGDTVIEEWVDPEDGFKAVFFYNVIGAILESNNKPGALDLIQIGTTVAYVDEFPVFVPGPFFLKYAVTHALLTTVSSIGWLMGYKPWVKEYTPEHIWEIARTRGGRHRGVKVE
ncbi:uncharacterized protein LTR77_010719 [Saxophila tyrrhenica]|uniref:Cupin 2 conserved barrel domain-containing protein n=1 Tax=Saxophila tyrrhenica TaxID=1690608 RepID=A0AAV9NX39_9PEZI|nr:hypothetical protein LTR77_010719 [Saxophila tyrrhenica]